MTPEQGPTELPSLRVCLVGRTSPRPAEGMENILASLAESMGSRADVFVVDGRRLPVPWTLRKVRQFRPDVVHFVAGPSLLTLALARMARTTAGRPLIVVSAVHPKGLGDRRMVQRLAPDVVLTQASDTEAFFAGLGIRTEFVVNGVDLGRFRPIEPDTKAALRREHGLPMDRRIALHVGHLKPARNVLALLPLQSARTQLVVVGSSSTRPSAVVRTALQAAGAIVIDRYMPRIEDLYQASDVYVFPTEDRESCIETPLSVLEALACGLGVVTTPFGALPRLFRESDHLLYTTSWTPDTLDTVRPGSEHLVAALGWPDVAHRILKIYAAGGHNPSRDHDANQYPRGGEL